MSLLFCDFSHPYVEMSQKSVFKKIHALNKGFVAFKSDSWIYLTFFFFLGDSSSQTLIFK